MPWPQPRRLRLGLRSCAGALAQVCQPAGFVTRGHRGGHVRTEVLAVSGLARSSRALGMVGADGQPTAVCASDPGDARSEQHHAAADIDADATNTSHESRNQPSSGSCSKSRVTHNQCRQRPLAAGGRARAPVKRFVMTLFRPREVWPTRFPPGWPGSLPTARAPQPSRFGHTRITRARLLKVVATSRNASLAADRASKHLGASALGHTCGPQRFRG